MQDYNKISIKKEEILPTAERMRTEGRMLVMIHGYVDKDGQNVVSYDYAVGQAVESYFICGEKLLPSIGAIYDQAAIWPERELTELMGLEFSGLDTSERLFLADNMQSGQGQIIVTPLAELREKNITEALASSQNNRGGLQ
jgi:Ni,Fe-hydrogenase III component G